MNEMLIWLISYDFSYFLGGHFLCFFLATFFCRYIVGPKEKQATFTGREQRRGVYIVPLAVPGVFKLLWQPPAPTAVGDSPAGVLDNGTDAAVMQTDAPSQSGDESGHEAGEDEAAARVDKSFTFDWEAYHRAFGDTPYDEAVTAMFAEYALLYERMAGYVGDAFPPQMTLTEARSIKKQTTRFINDSVTPVMGTIYSSKIHRLLCHVFEAIRDHGSLCNSNTAMNEFKHKEDKAHYVRTNKNPKTYTRQVVRHAQGSRLVRLRLEAEDDAAVAAKAARREQRAAALAAAARACNDSDISTADDSDVSVSSAGAGRSAASSSSGESASTASSSDASTDASTATEARTAADTGSNLSVARDAHDGGGRSAARKRVYHVTRTTVASPAQRPGLADAARLLELPPETAVGVLKSLRICARFECGGTLVQDVRGSPEYRGAPWCDAILFQPTDDASRSRAAEVRALARLPQGDVALVV